ncbi:HAD family hydrolase [Kitasatospora sp. NPDC057198]|uniref:HAD family hydrolase n=1 Tax=Kitasatospora sp. NPDC057198 TaxID=3346046 RepID=UPI00362A4120
MVVAAGAPVLVFDLDGVLFDTEAVKLAAFRDAFAPLCGADPGALERVAEYNAAHRGVPREVKIRHLLAGMPGVGEDGFAEVSGRYRELLAERLAACGPVAGVPGFLDGDWAVRYVASSAPVTEIRAHLERHGLADAFRRLFGHPCSKERALREVTAAHPGADLLFFGDAPADLAAARAAGVAFAAVNPHPALAAAAADRFADFTGVDRAAVARLARPVRPVRAVAGGRPVRGVG